MKFKNKLQLHIKECENKDFCEIIILFEDKKNIWILVNINNMIKHLEYLIETNPKIHSQQINMSKIKNIIKLEVIVILRGNIELLHVAYVVLNIVYLKKFL